jgi:hypothetical protein
MRECDEKVLATADLSEKETVSGKIIEICRRILSQMLRSLTTRSQLVPNCEQIFWRNS